MMLVLCVHNQYQKATRHPVISTKIHFQEVCAVRGDLLNIKVLPNVVQVTPVQVGV